MGSKANAETGAGVGAALFGTVRRRVLGLLFREYERDFYQREVVEAVDCGSGAVQRELKQLADAGLITCEKRGRMVFYQANQDAAVFEELRGLVMKTSGLADVIREALEPDASRIEVAFIYGSMAEGTDDAHSDVDVMVIGDIGLRGLSGRISAPQLAINREINPIIWSAADLRERLRSDHYFARSVMRGPKVFLKGDEDELWELASQREVTNPRAGM
jgi:predicted nucleotidyltransferase